MKVIWIVLIAFTYAVLPQGKLNLSVFTKSFKLFSLKFLFSCVTAFGATELVGVGDESKSSGRENKSFFRL